MALSSHVEKPLSSPIIRAAKWLRFGSSSPFPPPPSSPYLTIRYLRNTGRGNFAFSESLSFALSHLGPTLNSASVNFTISADINGGAAFLKREREREGEGASKSQGLIKIQRYIYRCRKHRYSIAFIAKNSSLSRRLKSREKEKKKEIRIDRESCFERRGPSSKIYSASTCSLNTRINWTRCEKRLNFEAAERCGGGEGRGERGGERVVAKWMSDGP